MLPFLVPDDAMMPTIMLIQDEVIADGYYARSSFAATGFMST